MSAGEYLLPSGDHWQQKDPQRVVIDEVSGQHLALLLGSALPVWWRTANSWAPPQLGFITYQSALGWKHLLLTIGWQSFYAALGVWLGRAFGL